MRGAATADVMTPLRNSYEGDDYDRHDQDELDATAGVVIALAALVPLRLCVELLRLSAPGAVLLAVQSLKALELRAPALGHGAAGGLFNALARHSPALQSLTISNGDGELANALRAAAPVQSAAWSRALLRLASVSLFPAHPHLPPPALAGRPDWPQRRRPTNVACGPHNLREGDL